MESHRQKAPQSPGGRNGQTGNGGGNPNSTNDRLRVPSDIQSERPGIPPDDRSERPGIPPEDRSGCHGIASGPRTPLATAAWRSARNLQVCHSSSASRASWRTAGGAAADARRGPAERYPSQSPLDRRDQARAAALEL